MCFHTGMTAGFVWDLGTQQEREATKQETVEILKEIDSHFRQQLDGLTFKHHWSDFTVSCLLRKGEQADLFAVRPSLGVRSLKPQQPPLSEVANSY